MLVNTRLLTLIFTDWRVLINFFASMLNLFAFSYADSFMTPINFGFFLFSGTISIWFMTKVYEDFKAEEFFVQEFYDQDVPVKVYKKVPKVEVQPEPEPEPKQVYCTVKD